MAGNQRSYLNNQRNNFPLQKKVSKEEWIQIFRRYDYDNDDMIPVRSFIEELRDATDGDIPILIIEKALREADKNGDRIISLDEFLALVQKSAQGKSKSGRVLTDYIRKTVPPRQRIVTTADLEAYYTNTDGEYEDEYKFWPPPLGMICFSIIEILTFIYDLHSQGFDNILDGPAADLMMYNPYRRQEAWRFVTYMFIHAGTHHLVVNLVVQIFLGIPLEMVHGWWRVLIVYVAGVMAGSLATSVLDPYVYLVGASGGVYSLLTAHLATIIMNWAEMEFGKWQLLIVLLLCILDTSSAVYNRYVLEINKQIGYEAHLAGAIAGLLVGIYILRNLEVRTWENKIWWGALIIYVAFMSTGILIHCLDPSHFPTQTVGYIS